MDGLEAIILEYRSPDLTRACIRRLVEEGVGHIVVVDNSDDGGASRRDLESGLELTGHLRLVDSGANLGFAAGVNLGLRHCSSDRVLLINNDAVVMPGAVHSMRDALDANPSAALSFPTLLHSGERVDRVFYHALFATISSRKLPGAFEVPRGCCMLLARDRIPPGDLFDERFFMYGEEIELGLRLLRLRIPFVHAVGACVEHRGSATARVGSPFYEAHTARAHVLLTEDLADAGPVGQCIRIARLASIHARALLRCARAGSLMPLRALRGALRCAPGVLPPTKP